MAQQAIVGEKVGMTQTWVDDKVVPVTVLRVEPMRIVQIKTNERDGYTALQVTSAPVPAVVRAAIQGAETFVSGRPQPMTSRYSITSPGLLTRAVKALPVSMTLPPPKPMTTSSSVYKTRGK